MLRVNGRWEPMSSGGFLRRIAVFLTRSNNLASRPVIGLACLRLTRPEWHIADFAVLGLGAIDVPIYFNESPTGSFIY